MKKPWSPDPDAQAVLTDRDAASRVVPLRHWSLQRSNDGGSYLLGLTTEGGAKCVLRLRSLDILGMAHAVLDDMDRADAAPTVQ